MSEPQLPVTEAQRRAAAFLARHIAFEPKSEAMLEAEQKELRCAAEEEVAAMVGTVISNGAVFAGASPSTGSTMYAAPHDAGVLMDFNEAAAYVDGINQDHYLGYTDWRLPSLAELEALRQSGDKGALQGTFNTSAVRGMENFYWSSLRGPALPTGTLTDVWAQNFSDGGQHDCDILLKLSVRCVRS